MQGKSAGSKLLIGCGLGGAALLSMLAMEGTAREGERPITTSAQAQAQGSVPRGAGADQRSDPSSGAPFAGPPRSGEAQQALAGLTRIRQQQCQMGNHLACQALPQMPAIAGQLEQTDAACRSGDRGACRSFTELAQKISTAYAESAAVMQAGEASMAQMDAWRAQMNQNAASSMANLRARGEAGQVAHNARQEANAAMNRAWQSGQAADERIQGRYVDGIYGGTTMDGGGVQARVPYGSTGYTDGYGNVIADENGGRVPDGWTPMDPTYAVPE